MTMMLYLFTSREFNGKVCVLADSLIGPTTKQVQSLGHVPKGADATCSPL